MNESPEQNPAARIDRQVVIDAYKKFIDAGIDDPASLDLNDPEVVKANELWDKWMEEGDQLGESSDDVRYRHALDKTMVMIDAGFTGQKYLHEALDWIMQDAQNVEKIPNESEREKTRDLYAAAIRRVRGLLKE